MKNPKIPRKLKKQIKKTYAIKGYKLSKFKITRDNDTYKAIYNDWARITNKQ